MFFTKTGKFLTEKEKQVVDVKADLYAFRKAGIEGLYFKFVYDVSNPEKSVLQRIHGCSRKFANSFFKMPKMFRLKVPNIISVFVSESVFSDDIINWTIDRQGLLWVVNFTRLY